MKRKDRKVWVMFRSSDKEEYHEQLYAHKLNNLDDIDKFQKRHKLPKLTQEEVDNLNRSTSE